MPLRPEEIDPTIQALIKERMAHIFAQNAALSSTDARVKSAGTAAWKRTAAKYTGYFWGGAAAWFAGMISPPMLEGLGDGPAVMFLFLFWLLAGVLVVTGFRKTNKELTQYASPDVMRYAAALESLNRAERAYCEAVSVLIDAGKVLSDELQREVLQQLNGLLESYRRLEEPVRRARAASGTESIESLERELAGLMSRRDAQTDAEARATMDQTVELCRQRLEAARAIDPARQKAEAQQELIVQTMASVQARLGRTTGVHAKTEDLNLGELQQSVAQVNTQARAVEEAVAEVVAISA